MRPPPTRARRTTYIKLYVRLAGQDSGLLSALYSRCGAADDPALWSLLPDLLAVALPPSAPSPPGLGISSTALSALAVHVLLRMVEPLCSGKRAASCIEAASGSSLAANELPPSTGAHGPFLDSNLLAHRRYLQLASGALLETCAATAGVNTHDGARRATRLAALLEAVAHLAAPHAAAALLSEVLPPGLIDVLLQGHDG